MRATKERVSLYDLRTRHQDLPASTAHARWKDADAREFLRLIALAATQYPTAMIADYLTISQSRVEHYQIRAAELRTPTPTQIAPLQTAWTQVRIVRAEGGVVLRCSREFEAMYLALGHLLHRRFPIQMLARIVAATVNQLRYFQKEPTTSRADKVKLERLRQLHRDSMSMQLFEARVHEPFLMTLKALSDEFSAWKMARALGLKVKDVQALLATPV